MFNIETNNEKNYTISLKNHLIFLIEVCIKVFFLNFP